VTQFFLHLNLGGLGKYTATGANGGVGGSGSTSVGVDFPENAIGNKTGILVTCLKDDSVYSNPPFHIVPLFRTGNSIAIGVFEANCAV
jgi:hypothetical protein